MNNKNLEVSCLTGWSASVLEENLTPKVLTGAAKMLRTSRLYLKVDQTKTVSDLKRPARIDLSQESPVEQ
jgi:hypothetical protein